MKERIPFSKLKIHAPYRVFRKGRDGVIGLDTESLVTGYTFLATDSLGSYRWVRSADDVIEFLCNKQYMHSFNTFWNLNFDATVLLKWFGYDFCRALVMAGEAHYKDVLVKFVPHRFMIVRRGNDWFSFFDAAQYFVPRSLDGASKMYLGEAKIAVGSKEFHESDYGSEKILKYCLDDSRKCARLTQLLLTDLHDMGFSPSTLASPGTIVSEALVENVPDVTKIPEGALEYAYDSYKGGWMECFKRGYFKKLYDYDISSAYPYQVSKLIDLSGGTWVYKKGKPPGCDVGFVRCVVNIKSNVSPIIFQSDVNYTPIGRWNTKLALSEMRFVVDNKLGSVMVKDGWYFEPRASATKPFRYSMRHLFRQKSKIRNSWLPKSLSVALYGKFAQKDDEGNTGSLFNPVYASLITASTRLQIAKYALALPENLVLVSTDGLTFDAPLPSSLLSRGFGGLRIVHSSEGVVVGTNVYTLKGKYAGGSWRPGRFNWLKLLHEQPEAVEYSLGYFRYTTMAEGVKDPTKWGLVGVFDTFPYEFSINYDHKRLFKKVSRGDELLENQYGSVPWEVGIAEKRKELLWEMK